jgi:hypothetical protein
MGRTVSSITQTFLKEQAAFARFRRALRRQDQLALDELFASARKHLSAASYASHALPFETFLLAMLLEEHKEVLRLRRETGQLRAAAAELRSDLDCLQADLDRLRAAAEPAAAEGAPPGSP